jgi:hypothetical protein
MPINHTFKKMKTLDAKTGLIGRAVILGLCLSLMMSLTPVNSLIASAHAASLSPLTATLDPAFAVEWMRLVYSNVKADTVDAPSASRVYAYAGVTLYEAVLPGIPGDVSLSTQIKDMPNLPAPDVTLVYDWATVANGAIHTVMDSLLVSDASHKASADLYDKQLTARKIAVGADVATRSDAQGVTLGKAIVEWSTHDHAADALAQAKTYKLPTGGTFDYVLTTAGTKPVGSFWGTVKPFALEKANICNVPLNITPSADPNSAFYKQALEVKTVGDNLTDEQKAIANWWVDTPGLTGAPSGHWVEIENQMVGDLSLKLDKAAEMYALVGISLADAFISCWELKYEAPLLRPVTYINKYISPRWQSYIASPPFPTYVSGHSVASQAAADVLTALFGQVAFTDTTHVSDKQAARSFTSFQAAASEAAISRLYGGIHFRFDIENGMRQGQCVAQQVTKAIHLQATQ